MSDLCRRPLAAGARNPRRQQGIVLVLVLWVALILTTVVTSFAFVARTETTIASSSIERAQARELAKAAMQWAIADIARAAPAMEAGREIFDSWTYMLGAQRLAVAVRPISGFVDINRGSDDLIKSAVAAALGGPDAEHALLIADRLLDWRDSNRRRRLNGAEDVDYRRAKRYYGARDGAFMTVNELSQVLGVDGDTFDKLLSVFTTHAGRSKVELAYAPAALVAALTNVSPSAVEAAVEARQAGEFSDLDTVALSASTRLAQSTSSSGQRARRAGIYRLTALGISGSSRHYQRMVVRIRVQGESARRRLRVSPYEVLEWSSTVSRSEQNHLDSLTERF